MWKDLDMNNIPEIKDIHIPSGVSPFPLAYGWWVVLLIVILSVVLLYFLFWAFKTSKKYYALKTLDKIKTTSVVGSAIEMSELLRRICKTKYREASALYGQEWGDFLKKGTTFNISEKALELLLFAPFINKQTNKYSVEHAQELKLFCKNWIGANL